MTGSISADSASYRNGPVGGIDCTADICLVAVNHADRISGISNRHTDITDRRINRAAVLSSSVVGNHMSLRRTENNRCAFALGMIIIHSDRYRAIRRIDRAAAAICCHIAAKFAGQRHIAFRRINRAAVVCRLVAGHHTGHRHQTLL